MLAADHHRRAVLKLLLATEGVSPDLRGFFDQRPQWLTEQEWQRTVYELLQRHGLLENNP
jgi:hypothetical protein